MARKNGGASPTIELDVSDRIEFAALCEERGMKRNRLGSILLRYAMKRVELALKEWQKEGGEATRKRRNAEAAARLEVVPDAERATS